MNLTVPIDKSSWPPGPWHDEPDELEWWDANTGYTCFMRRHPTLGHWCGYVRINAGHGLWCSNVKQDYWPVRVHGGITGSMDSHTPGFDCAHGGDLSPGVSYYAKHPGKLWSAEIYRDVHWVIKECQRFAQELKKHE